MLLVSCEKEEVSCCGFTTGLQYGGSSGLYIVRSRGFVLILAYKVYGNMVHISRSFFKNTSLSHTVL